MSSTVIKIIYEFNDNDEENFDKHTHKSSFTLFLSVFDEIRGDLYYRVYRGACIEQYQWFLFSSIFRLSNDASQF